MIICKKFYKLLKLNFRKKSNKFKNCKNKCKKILKNFHYKKFKNLNKMKSNYKMFYQNKNIKLKIINNLFILQNIC